MYLKRVELGRKGLGMKRGCDRYFNRSGDKIRVEEGGRVMGVVKGSSYYNGKMKGKKSV